MTDQWCDTFPPLNLWNWPSFYIGDIMHPLVGDLSGLSNEELHKKHSDLMKRFNQAYKFGPTSIIPQMQMVLANYQAEIDNRNRKLAEEMDKRADKYKGVIDIQ